MMTMRLQVILEHIPITQDQIQNYIVHTQVNKAAYTVLELPFLYRSLVCRTSSQDIDTYMLAGTYTLPFLSDTAQEMKKPAFKKTLADPFTLEGTDEKANEY